MAGRAPAARRHGGLAEGVWTGTEILVWGGVGEDRELVSTGAAFTPPAP